MCLVEVKEDSVYCDSSMIAKKFEVKHAYVIRNCNSLIADIEKFKGDFKSPLVIKEQRNYRGADYTAYLMTREFFSLLCMRFKGRKAIEWQIKFNQAFYEMERSLVTEQSVMDKCNRVIAALESDKAVASVHGQGLANWRKQKKDHMEKVSELKDTAQMLLGFEE